MSDVENSAETPKFLSYRDLLMAKQNGFDIDGYQLYLWRREEELIRSVIEFPQHYASCNLIPDHFEAPIHRLAWKATLAQLQLYAGIERIDAAGLASDMMGLDAEVGLGAKAWIGVVMQDLPVQPTFGLDQVVRDIFNNVRLSAYSKVQGKILGRIRKDTRLSDLQATIVSTARDLVYDYDGEGKIAPPLSAIKWDSRDKSKINVVRTGIDAIDRAAGGGHGRGELLVWGGGTSHGKSFAMQRLLRRQAELKQNALYISCEDPLELMQCRMIADFCEPSISPKDIRMRVADPEAIDLAVARMNSVLGDHVTVIEHKKPNVSDVCNTIRYYRYSRNVDLVIVDYLQAVNDDDSVGQKTMDTANVISKLKKCFTECKVAGVVLTQYARNEYREGEEPSINAAKYAGDIENEAEILAFMWKDSDDELHVKLPKVKWSRAKQLRYTIPTDPITGCHRAWVEDHND